MNIPILPQGFSLDMADVIRILEHVFVVGFLLILLLFAVQKVQQVRLLNRFLNTTFAPVWAITTWVFLLAIIMLGVWYALVYIL